MRPDPSPLVEAVRAWRVEPFDMGVCNGREFVLMASIGFDADVLHALAARRTGPISHTSYIAPVVHSLLRPTIRALTVEVDGRTIVDGRQGNIVVANCGRYALGLDPCPDARMDDGALDVVFAPSGSSLRTLAWMGMALARVGTRSRSLARARGSHITVRVDRAGACTDPPAARFQLDGEALRSPASAGVFTLGVRARALPVLLPA